MSDDQETLQFRLRTLIEPEGMPRVSVTIGADEITGVLTATVDAQGFDDGEEVATLLDLLAQLLRRVPEEEPTMQATTESAGKVFAALISGDPENERSTEDRKVVSHRARPRFNPQPRRKS